MLAETTFYKFDCGIVFPLPILQIVGQAPFMCIYNRKWTICLKEKESFYTWCKLPMGHVLTALGISPVYIFIYMYLYILYMLQNMHYMLCTLSVGLEVKHDLNIDD